MIRVITSRTIDQYKVEVNNYADNWQLQGPVPDSWNELVYRVMKDDKKVKNIPLRIAKIGAKLVDDLNRFYTPEGTNAFIEIANWMKG